MIPPIHVYINSIHNRSMFKIEDGYKLELQTYETMKLFASAKKIIDQSTNRENVPSLEVVEVVLVQFNLLYNQYQQKSEAFLLPVKLMAICYMLNQVI